MKKNVKIDKDELRKQVKDELGVDLNTYIDKEAISNFANVLILPKVILKLFSIVFLALVTIYFTTLYAVPNFTAGWFASLIIGFVLAVLNMVTVTTAVTTMNLKEDITDMVEYVCNMFNKIIPDAKLAFDNGKESGYKSLMLLFKGVIWVTIMPTLTHAINKKFPFKLGYLITVPVNFIMGVAVAYLHTSSEKLPETDQELIETYDTPQMIEYITEKVSAIINKALNGFVLFFSFPAMITLALHIIFLGIVL